MGKAQRNSGKLKIISNNNNNQKNSTTGRKRWAKGHSSDSNPTIKLHRDAARIRFYYPGPKAEDLSMRDMKMLERMDLNLGDKRDDDAGSVDSKETVATRLSNITNCTNPTFDKVHRIWKSGSKLHADVLTILASVTDAIKSKGGKESEVEYFAALLNPLADPQYSSNLLAATSYLLNLVVRKVSKAILVQQFGRIAEIIYGVVKRIGGASSSTGEMDEHDVAILRYLISALGYLLEIRPNILWSTPPHDIVMTKVFDTILEFTIHEKPRIRKSAQKAVVQLMINAVSTPAVVSKKCSEFAIGQLERFGGGRANNAQTDVTLHVLNLLQHVMHRFGSTDLKRTTETIFKLLALSNNLTSTMGAHALYMMCRNRPPVESMSADLNAKIILAIYDFQPSPKDVRSCSNWIQLIVEAHACLLERDASLSAEYVTRLAETVARFLADSEHPEIVAASVGGMKKIYGDFVSDVAKSTSSQSTQSLETSLEVLEKLLSAQYYSTWPQVFGLFALFFESVGSSIGGSLRNLARSLKIIAELREGESFPCKLPAEQAIGAAIRHIGPEQVLTVLPLGLNADSPTLAVMEFPRSWLLPLLRSKVNGARIGFFAAYFLPLAIKIDQRAKELQASANPMVEVKVLEAVECQIWELFPAFCNRPIDVADSFATLARALGAALVGRPKLRLSILSGLRKLLSMAENDENKATMAKYGKNYLNILLQLYTSDKPDEPILDYDEDGTRAAVLETIKLFLAVAPSDLIETYLETASDKLKRDEASDGKAMERKCRLMDILIALAAHLDGDQRRTVYELVVETMATAESRLQKKCWRLVEEMCGHNSEENESFIDANLSALRSLLGTNLTSAAPATKACRLRCLSMILDHLKKPSSKNSSFVLSTLPDAILCLQGSSLKARRCAAKFIVKAVMVLSKWNKDVNASLRTVFEAIMDEKEGTTATAKNVHRLTGSIAAARLLCYEFRNDISADLISFVLGKVCALLREDKRRPIAQACVEFLKTFVGCFPEVTVGQFLDTIITALCEQNEDCQKHSRRVTRKVMAKLVKRFSYVTIKKFVPDVYEKQLKNIRKLVARSEKTSAASKDEKSGAKRTTIGSVASSVDDETGTVFTAFTNLSRPETIADLLRDTSDEESDGEDDKKSKRGGRSMPVWLKDGGEDEVVDMMDKMFVQQISATKPKLQSRRGEIAAKKSESVKNRGFKTASDGRLMITMEKDDDEEDGDENNKARKRKRLTSADSVDDTEDLKGPKKRQHVQDDYDAGNADGEEAEGTSAYVPGGKGIHRRTSDKASKNDQTQGKSKSGGKGEKKKPKGDLDPYTYVPMDRKALNKRKRAKLGGQFKNLIQGAKKGASKGSKGKKKNTK